MIQKLVVTKTFDGFVRGDVITDPDKIRQIMQSDHRHSVRPVAQSTPAKA